MFALLATAMRSCERGRGISGTESQGDPTLHLPRESLLLDGYGGSDAPCSGTGQEQVAVRRVLDLDPAARREQEGSTRSRGRRDPCARPPSRRRAHDGRAHGLGELGERAGTESDVVRRGSRVSSCDGAGRLRRHDRRDLADQRVRPHDRTRRAAAATGSRLAAGAPGGHATADARSVRGRTRDAEGTGDRRDRDPLPPSESSHRQPLPARHEAVACGRRILGRCRPVPAVDRRRELSRLPAVGSGRLVAPRPRAPLARPTSSISWSSSGAARARCGPRGASSSGSSCRSRTRAGVRAAGSSSTSSQATGTRSSTTCRCVTSCPSRCTRSAVTPPRTAVARRPGGSASRGSRATGRPPPSRSAARRSGLPPVPRLDRHSARRGGPRLRRGDLSPGRLPTARQRDDLV